MKTYNVINLLGGEESDTPENAVYTLIIDRLGFVYRDFDEVYTKHTFNLVWKHDNRRVYSVIRI